MLYCALLMRSDRSRGLVGRNRCRIDLFRYALVAAGGLRYKNGGEETKQANYDREYPCSFFQYVRSLLNAHELVAEAAYVSCQAAPLGVLHQDNQSEDRTGKNDQDHEKNHIKEY